jgi:predicted nuclease with RNAse H fold
VFLGVDVGAVRLHCVALDREGTVTRSAQLSASELPELAELASEAEIVAVDAPAAPSTVPHWDDPDPKLAPKFRVARCAEVELGRELGIWVPWVAPEERPTSGWMATGFAVYDALEQAGRGRVIEVYPHGAFRVLARGAPLARKQTVQGARERLTLLRGSGLEAEHLELWSHDGIDAAVSALVALHRAEGRARAVGCGHDESSIWLPEAALG